MCVFAKFVLKRHTHYCRSCWLWQPYLHVKTLVCPITDVYWPPCDVLSYIFQLPYCTGGLQVRWVGFVVRDQKAWHNGRWLFYLCHKRRWWGRLNRKLLKMWNYCFCQNHIFNAKKHCNQIYFGRSASCGEFGFLNL